MCAMILVTVFLIGIADPSWGLPPELINLEQSMTMETIKLPKPVAKGAVSVEEALLKRRSVREFSRSAISLEEIGQLLWAAQGITDQARGLRTAPSAGALYPLELSLVAANVKGLPVGVYRYSLGRHELARTHSGDIRQELSHAALDQDAVRNAAAVIVISAVYERTAVKYKSRSTRYVHMEVGHASENVFLQAVALDLGTVVVGAFQDDEVKKIVGLKDEEAPLYLMPVGKAK